MSRVITYRLAYLAREVTLCDGCLERDDHERGSIGPVTHGQHWGTCQGKNHATGRIRSLRLSLTGLKNDAEYHDLCRTHGEYSREVLRHLESCARVQARRENHT